MIRRRDPFARAQIAPLRLRRATGQPIELHPNLARLSLLRAVAAGDVKPGRGRYAGGWRWSGVTVTNRINELAQAEWITVSEAPRRRVFVAGRGDELLAAHPRNEGRGTL